MLAIYIKELKSYFKSILGWLFLAAFVFIAGLYFSLNNLYFGNPYISETLHSLLIIILFILPLITMRSFSEEKKLKTDQLLLTAPVRVSAIIAGKFFAMVTMMAIATAIFSLGIILMVIYGSIPVGETILAIVAFFLYGCICIAVGMFLSSVTEHQFVAALLTYGIFIFMILVPSFCSILFGADSWITKLVGVIDFITPFDMLFSGIIVVSDIVYILSAIFIFLLLTHFMIGRNSFQLSAEGKKQFFKTFVGTLVILVLVVGLNIGVRYLPSEYAQFDMTKNHWYSITQDTKELLDTLEEEVTIYVIGDEETTDGVVKMYLDSYSKYSNKINVEYKPLNLYPNFASEYAGTALDVSSMIVAMGDDMRVVSYVDCYVVEYGYDMYGQLSNYVTGIDIEGQITAAISSMLSGETYTVYMLTGHNEVVVGDSILSRFRKGGFQVQELSLLHETKVPEDAVTLIINGPESDLSQEEVKAVKQYVEQGGNLIMMASLDIAETPNYDELMESYGVTMTEGSVLESNYYYVYNNIPFALLPDSSYHEITMDIHNSKYALLIQSRGFTVDEDVTGSMEVYPLFLSSEGSYAKVLTADEIVDYEEGDEIGPFALGIVVDKYLDNGETAHITMIGTPAFLYEDVDMVVSNANSEVLIAAVEYGAQVELTTTIPAKSVSPEYITISSGLIRLYTSLIVLILPMALIISGIVIVIMRRKK